MSLHFYRRLLIGGAVLFAVGALSSCASTPLPEPSAGSIGSAKMLPDGTISLQLRAEGDSAVGDALIYVKPNDPRYTEILTHLGGLEPGEEKAVPPWPSTK